MNKIFLSSILVLVILFLSSCSYISNIDNKLFVSAIGIDLNDDGDFSLTLSYPDISEFSPESSKIKEGGSVSGFGRTFYEAIKDSITRTNKFVDLEHVKVIVFSSNIISNKENFENVLDYLSHNYEINRRVYLCVGDGKANDFMNFKSKTSEHSQVFISELLDRNSKDNGINIMTLNKIIDYFYKNKSVLLPVIELNEDKTEMNIFGSYVLDNFNNIEKINMKESMFINFLRGDNKKISNYVSYNYGNVDFESTKINRDVKIFDYGNVNVNLDIDIKTTIKNCMDLEHDFININFIKELKFILDKNMYNDCINLVNRFYKMGIDILNFEDYIYRFNFDTWDFKIKENKNWMDTLQVNINIFNDIVNIGNITV